MGESQLLLTSCGSVSKHLEIQHSTSLEDYKNVCYNGHSFFLILSEKNRENWGKQKHFSFITRVWDAKTSLLIDTCPLSQRVNQLRVFHDFQCFILKHNISINKY